MDLGRHEVEAIVGIKEETISGKSTPTFYKIRWKAGTTTWEPIENVDNCEECKLKFAQLVKRGLDIWNLKFPKDQHIVPPPPPIKVDIHKNYRLITF